MLGLLVVLALGADPGALLFDAGEGRWLVMSRAGETLRVVADVAGRKPKDAAISPDGTAWGFVADEQLFVWREGWGAARVVPRAGDVLMSPAFSSDGQWLLFIQNDLETMRAKVPMRYSQVWRVRAEGGHPEKLTRSAGCHMWPSPTPGGGALITHATCRGGRGIDLLSPTGKEEVLRGTDSQHGEAALDAGGTRVAFVRDGLGTELYVLDLKTRKESFWARVPWRTLRLRPAWAADGKSLWIQNEEAVWRIAADGSVTRHVAFAELQGAR